MWSVHMPKDIATVAATKRIPHSRSKRVPSVARKWTPGIVSATVSNKRVPFVFRFGVLSRTAGFVLSSSMVAAAMFHDTSMVPSNSGYKLFDFARRMRRYSGE